MDEENESLRRFCYALEQGVNASALSLLEKGRVTIHSVRPFEVNGVHQSIPVLHLAVHYVREQVVRALLRLGADIDASGSLPNGKTSTPVGVSIYDGGVSMLALCHRLGAKMSRVCPPASPPESTTALATPVCAAIQENEPACLAYLLDYVYVARPVELNRLEMLVLSMTTFHGGSVKAVFAVLKTRGFNCQLLAEEKVPSNESDPSSFADILVPNAQKSGDAALMRYVVKDLGFGSTVGRIDLCRAGIIEGSARQSRILKTSRQSPAEVAMRKYECTACDAVGATLVCTGCRVVRYCSKDCSKRHWKTGGHKKECKELKHDVSESVSSSGSVGPSQA